MEFIYTGILILLILQFLKNDNRLSHTTLCFYLFLYLFLASALKSTHLTGDLVSYSNAFTRLCNETYEAIFQRWLDGAQKDPTFYAVAKLLSSVGINIWGWFAIIAMLFAASFAHLIKKFSPIPFISCLTLISLEIFDFSMSGLRQAMALSFVCFAYPCILERKLKNYLLCMLMAWAFHSSALIFLPAYWLASYRIGTKQVMIIAIGVVICVFAPATIRNTLGNLAWNDSIANYQNQKTALTWSGFIIQISIFAFCFCYRHCVTKDKLSILTICLNCMTVGLIFQSMASIIAEAFRAAYYYNLCNMIAIPIVIAAQQKHRDRVIMASAISFVLFLYMLWKQSYFNYVYFWE